jgi:hypothetical protein
MSKVNQHRVAFERGRPFIGSRSISLLVLHGFVISLGAGHVTRAIAQPAETTARPAELLNSERIERTFGSYGIEVLESDAKLRVSNLYTVERERKICRTFAVVRYPDRIDPMFAAEHELIRGGGSIGSVFATRGWTVEKSHRYYGELEASARVAALMQIAPPAQLAVHVYALDIAKESARYRYATIVEIHHPEYLTAENLAQIYGPLAQASDDATLEMLEIAASKMR